MVGEQGRTHIGHNGVVDEIALVKAHFVLARMDVDVHDVRVTAQKDNGPQARLKARIVLHHTQIALTQGVIDHFVGDDTAV